MACDSHSLSLGFLVMQIMLDILEGKATFVQGRFFPDPDEPLPLELNCRISASLSSTYVPPSTRLDATAGASPMTRLELLDNIQGRWVRYMIWVSLPSLPLPPLYFNLSVGNLVSLSRYEGSHGIYIYPYIL